MRDGDAREAALAALLSRAGWADATRRPLAGDASARRYERLERPGTGDTAVLMDAPPARGEDVRPFVAIAEHLASLGLSAPRILAADTTAGFLLLEDLGDTLFARHVDQAPQDEPKLYEAAVDLLAGLHRHPPPPEVARYDPAAMARRVRLAADWYVPGLTGAPAPPGLADRLEAATRDTLDTHAAPTPVLALRDYHAENLVWLPGRNGPARVGLLDFQDAMAGHPAYDLVSLLQDARRDVPEALAADMTDRYAAATGADPESLAAACAVLGAQRNLRILGVFARLCLRDAKPGYVDLIGRVWGLLGRDLAHPAAAPVARVAAALPAPTGDGLARLREAAGTCQTP